MPADPVVSPADTRELDGLRKLYGQKCEAISVALGYAMAAQDNLAVGNVDFAADDFAKAVRILAHA